MALIGSREPGAGAALGKLLGLSDPALRDSGGSDVFTTTLLGGGGEPIMEAPGTVWLTGRLTKHWLSG